MRDALWNAPDGVAMLQHAFARRRNRNRDCRRLARRLDAARRRAGPGAPGEGKFPDLVQPGGAAQFERAVALEHSFWFGEAIKGFNAVAQADPSCGIAHWGAAVAWLGNPLAGRRSRAG